MLNIVETKKSLSVKIHIERCSVCLLTVLYNIQRKCRLMYWRFIITILLNLSNQLHNTQTKYTRSGSLPKMTEFLIIPEDSWDLITEIGRQIGQINGVTREASFLFQRVPAALQRDNYIRFTMCHR